MKANTPKANGGDQTLKSGPIGGAASAQKKPVTSYTVTKDGAVKFNGARNTDQLPKEHKASTAAPQ